MLGVMNITVKIMKVFILIIIMLFTNPAPGNSIASKSRVLGDGRLADTCQEVTAALVSFKFFATFWEVGPDGGPQSRTTSKTAEGEWFTDAVTFYKSKSGFKKGVRQINDDSEGVISRTALLDEKGRQIGQRVVKEIRAGDKAGSAFILLVTDRKVQAISGSSLKIALLAEKANACRAEAGRR